MKSIEWISRDKGKDTKVEISKISKITFGQKTQKFQRLSRSDVDNRSFSLWYTDREGKSDTLDLVCATDLQYKTWTTTISKLKRRSVPKSIIDSLANTSNNLNLSAGPDLLAASTKHFNKYEQALQDVNVIYRFGSNTWGHTKKLPHSQSNNVILFLYLITTGQLGGKNKMEKSPVLLHIQGSYDINEIDGGWSHSLLLMSDGSLAQMGRKIATGFDHDVSSPVLIDVNLVEGSVTEQASCGRSHNAIGTDDGKVYTWGNNFFGQLGHGDRMDRKTPMIVELKTQVMIRDIACGYDFTCALGDCQLFTWGSGKYGVLGHGDEKDRLSPCLIEDLDSITGMACGGHHVLAWSRKPAELVYSWGLNSSGQLGHGNSKSAFSPRLIPTFSNKHIISVACGAGHSLAVTFTNESSLTYACGSNAFGQLALGQCGQGAKVLTPMAIPSLSTGLRIQEVACGSMHSLARSESGEVFSSGCNAFGQLGLETKDRFLNRFTAITSLKDKNPRAIACGGMHSFVMCPKKWIKDEEVTNCMKCKAVFTFMRRKHHCRNCCLIFCNECSSKRIAILHLKLKGPQRVCEACYSQISGHSSRNSLRG
mmetsp:Transcript_15899/g.25166  ORF Transcript_15899/g.25166 Transcript_15899/m.25166 type:complete len:594 (-) Transcript_15899:75-1856(-)